MFRFEASTQRQREQQPGGLEEGDLKNNLDNKEIISSGCGLTY